jgi:hypothetical protein
MSGVFIFGVAQVAAVSSVSIGMLVTAVTAIGCAILATFLLPETAGRDLAAPVTSELPEAEAQLDPRGAASRPPYPRGDGLV